MSPGRSLADIRLLKAPSTCISAGAPPSPFAKPFREEKTSGKMPYILGGSAFVAILGVGFLVHSMVTNSAPARVNIPDPAASKSRKTQTAPKLSEAAFLSDAEQAQLSAEAERQPGKVVAPPVFDLKTKEKPVAIETPKAAEARSDWMSRRFRRW